MLDVAIQSLLRELSSVLFETEIGEHSEPQPVCIWHAFPGLVKIDHDQGSYEHYFFSLMELPSQFSTFVFSFEDMDSQISGATAKAKPMHRNLEPGAHALRDLGSSLT